MEKIGYMVIALILLSSAIFGSGVIQLEPVLACEGPTCYEGLTPGYWKNHIENWVGYSPGDFFDVIFGTSALPGVTLIEALNLNGGGLNALARHAVAALLNAANPEINYCYSECAIIGMVQAAISSGDYEPLKDELEELNNRGLSDGDD